MPRKSNTRAAQGSGTIRQRADGTWEARFVVGHDPGTGKPVRKSVYAKTQKEVRQKLAQAVAAVDNKSYREPCKMTLGEWLDIWVDTYLKDVKPRTLKIYQDDIRLHIKPYLAAVKLNELDTHTVQRFFNTLLKSGKRVPKRDKEGKIVKKDGKTVYEGAPLSSKTVKNVHGVLHGALRQAVVNRYIPINPADGDFCKLPKIQKQEIKPLDEVQIADFLKAIHGDRFEELFLVTLFTGLRQGEVLGLTWDCVDFDNGTLLVNKQMQLHQERGIKAYQLVPTKNSKSRTITAAPSVMSLLRRRRAIQAQQHLEAGPLWQDSDLVFTDELGRHLTKSSVYRSFKKIVAAIGRPDARFHDLRHSYAVAAIRSGDDIKTVQGNLGHATAAFTLDVYGHVTDQMKQASAARMEAFIKSVSNG
ncbi:MAG TPA: site-specific integrase [Candidatus Flavonifractor intestinigallinarum]|uniref:Site-specific integrase n=1 Tax=Candidatus Flavonifractor intestinigallinarum TaxID=2838586 RepID=A0A9D2MMY4_9FIRM|nr:site-specific integrase [Candidatus Flavonifractor intestinigallinarum]